MTQTISIELGEHKGDIVVDGHTITAVPPCFSWMKGQSIDHIRHWVLQRKGKLRKKVLHA